MVRILSYLKISCICRHVPLHLLQPFELSQDPSYLHQHYISMIYAAIGERNFLEFQIETSNFEPLLF